MSVKGTVPSSLRKASAKIGEAVLQDIARLRLELGFALILVTHDPAEVHGFCTSLAVLDGGRIAESGPLDTVAACPRTELARALVARLQPESGQAKV